MKKISSKAVSVTALAVHFRNGRNTGFGIRTEWRR